MENHGLERKRATWVIGGAIILVSTIIILNFNLLFGLTVAIATRYSQPMLGSMLCIFAGWIWQRNSVLEELKKGFDDAEHGWFWKIWPNYVRYVCPAAILIVFTQRFVS